MSPAVSSAAEVDLQSCQVVSPQFFPLGRGPVMNVNLNIITVNQACLALLPDAEFVEFLVSPEEKKLLLLPCSEHTLSRYRWARVKDGKRVVISRRSGVFVMALCRMMGWNPDCRYKIPGAKASARGTELLVFDLLAAQCLPWAVLPRESRGGMKRQETIPAEWSCSFGPGADKPRRSLLVDTFDGFTVFSVRENAAQDSGEISS